jgi:hypothetical protein
MVVGVLASAAQFTYAGGKPAKETPPTPDAKRLGSYTIGIAMNMDVVSTSAGPRLLGLDGVFAAQRIWTVWDGATGKALARMTNNRGALTADESTLAMSPDGNRVALIYRWQVSQFSPPTDQVDTLVYDLKKRKAVFLDRRRGPVHAVVFTPKGRMLLFAGDQCHILEPDQVKLGRNFKLAAPMMGAAAVSAEDALLAVYAQGTLHVYDLAKGMLAFELVTDAKPKKVGQPKGLPGGGPFPGAVPFNIGGTSSAALTFSSAAQGRKLLIYEETFTAQGLADPKAFAMGQATEGQLRLIDLKEKKQVGGLKLAKGVTCVRAFFTSAGEPRALTATSLEELPGKILPKINPAPKAPFPVKGPVLPDTGGFMGPSSKVRFQMIDLTGKALHEFTLANPPLLIPAPPTCLLTADGRYLVALTTTNAQQKKSNMMATVWDLAPGK